MKTSVDQIGAALSMYYEGMSLNAIRRHLDQTHHNLPSDSTIYEWVERFTKQAINETKNYKPNVGDVWVADETVLKIDGANVWFWNIIDAKTRFLLASHVSRTRTTRDARRLMEKAQERAGKTPKTVITDKLAAYIDGIEQAFGADSKHIQSKPFSLKNANNLIERFHGTLKARTKVMRGLKEIDTARLFTDGWLVHYNFIRPHSAIGDKTPAEKAGIRFNYRNWLDIVKKPTYNIIVTQATVKEPSVKHARPSGIKVKQLSPKPMQQGRILAPMISVKEGRQYKTYTSGGVLLSRKPIKGARVIRSKKRGKIRATLSSMR